MGKKKKKNIKKDNIIMGKKKQAKKYYHYTTHRQAVGICLVEHLSCAWGNYMCDSMEDIYQFLRYSHIPNEELAVIQFTTEAELEESFDHNSNIIKAKAYVSFEPVKIDIINIKTFEPRVNQQLEKAI